MSKKTDYDRFITTLDKIGIKYARLKTSGIVGIDSDSIPGDSLQFIFDPVTGDYIGVD